MKLFISYSRQDKHWVYNLHDQLRENTSHHTWIDRNLVTSTDWWDIILENIESCDCYIFVMSTDSLTSEYCVTECEYALNLNKPIIPLMLKDCFDAIPSELSALKKKQVENLTTVPSITAVLLKIEQALSQIRDDIHAGKYEKQAVDRPLSPDDFDNAMINYEAALKDIDDKNYERAKRRLQRVIEFDNLFHSDEAQDILDNFDFFMKRHEAYKSVAQLMNQPDGFERAQAAWEKYVEKYGADYDPDDIGASLNDNDYMIAYHRILEAKATRLTAVNLTKLKLNRIPSEIGQLPNLIRLDLRLNELIELPKEIGQLTNLTMLDLDHNQLLALPSEIGQLANLRTLLLENNNLIVLPTAIKELVNLRELDLSKNQLRSLPSEVKHLANLRTLLLHHNALTRLPAEIGYLANLTALDISKNKLRSFPTETTQLVNLYILQLSENHLTLIPSEIGQLTDLTILYLQYNQLTALPSEIGQLTFKNFS